MKNKVADGDSVTFLIPDNAPTDPLTGLAVHSGDGVLCGNLFGIASTSEFPGNYVNLEVTGIFDLKKVPSLAITRGQKLYWDDKQKVLTTDPTLPLVATAVSDAAALENSVRVRILGVSIDPAPTPSGGGQPPSNPSNPTNPSNPSNPVRPSNG